ncbi:MAG: TonB family protein [Prevotella sp.]|jgi:protein TonB|nr:energy transducer TonB [Prevotella sp.]MBQ6422199.1 energy transducer TonB [Prevotella sp.]MDY6437623.1 TonB family protein [Prevotella sp.]
MTTDSSKSSIIVPSSYRRSVGFFLGLAVAVALLVMALEYNSAPADYDIDLSLLEHLDKDEEMIPVMEHQDLRPTVVEKEPESEPSVSEKLKEVDAAKLPEEMDKADLDTKEGKTENTATRPPEVPEALPQDLTKVPPVVLNINSDPANMRIVRDTPKPVDGWIAFMKWITATLRYPPAAKAAGKQGTVMVTFIVEPDGSITNIKAEKSPDSRLEAEALRVIGIMPKWKAGVEKGKPVRAKMAMPIVFKI